MARSRVVPSAHCACPGRDMSHSHSHEGDGRRLSATEDEGSTALSLGQRHLRLTQLQDDLLCGVPLPCHACPPRFGILTFGVDPDSGGRSRRLLLTQFIPGNQPAWQQHSGGLTMSSGWCLPPRLVGPAQITGNEPVQSPRPGFRLPSPEQVSVVFGIGPSPEERPDIFVSAASGDLGSARKLVKQGLLRIGCAPHGNTYHVALTEQG